MAHTPPSIVLLAGPNGAGKTTCAPRLLQGTLTVTEFVNADTIAQGLSAFRPGGVMFEAGRLMIDRLRDLASRGASFAFETTLASRAFAPWIRSLQGRGYRFRLVFLWLPSADLAVRRVEERVRLGGHRVPNEVVRRRYTRGLVNFFDLYQPLADTWRIYDNSRTPGPRLVARGNRGRVPVIVDADRWRLIEQASRR